jgi:prevent-host-death family protein
MSIKHTLSITEARKIFFEIVREVQKPANHYILTDKGRPKMVLLSADEYESIMETVDVLADFPDIDKDIKETAEAWKTGEWKKWPSLNDLKYKYNIPMTVADKPKHKYAVHIKNKTKGRKGTR